MKIVHVSPNATYVEGWGYQENLLPKYHKKLGHEVTLIVNTRIFADHGIGYVEECNYYSEDGVHIIRLKNKKYLFPKITPIIMRLSIFQYLCEIEPEFIFFHGLCSRTMDDCIRYKKYMKRKGKLCSIVADNHLDNNIGIKEKTIKQKILRTYFRMYNRRSQRYIEKVYGVTPWRKQYAEEYFHISNKMTDILVMGADDEKVDFENKLKIRKMIREQYGINQNDFLLVTGGKIDERKKIHLLMEACSQITSVKLLIFGSVEKDFESEFYDLLRKCQNVIYIGWIAADSVYDYFFAADLVVFPGQHSVLWEQACASKVPCVFAKWPGMEHVNSCGNASFFDEMNINAFKQKISGLVWTSDYYEMKKKAESNLTDVFLYSSIAKKSLECIRIDDKEVLSS